MMPRTWLCCTAAAYGKQVSDAACVSIYQWCCVAVVSNCAEPSSEILSAVHNPFVPLPNNIFQKKSYCMVHSVCMYTADVGDCTVHAIGQDLVQFKTTWVFECHGQISAGQLHFSDQCVVLSRGKNYQCTQLSVFSHHHSSSDF